MPSVTKSLPVLAFALAVWAFCGALIAIGRAFFAMDTTLILHAAGAPLGAAILSAVYFRRFGHFGPLHTALIFVGVSLALDTLVVAPLVERSFEMFASLLGVWVPQALVFAATVTTGLLLGKEHGRWR